MNLTEVIKIYNNGNYNTCMEIFLRDVSDSSSVDSHLYLHLENVEEMHKEYTYQNNIALCQALGNTFSDKHWQEALNQFIKLHSKYRSLTSISLDIEMNLVCNIVWWFSMYRNVQKYETLYFKDINQIIINVLMKVLKSCGELATGHNQPCSETPGFINLLRCASDHMLRLSPVVCKQLLDIITLTAVMHMRIDISEAIAEFVPFFRRIIDQFDLLRLHLQQDINSGLEEIYFKFGYTCVNATASLKYCMDSLNALALTGSVVCAVNNEFDYAMDSLKQIKKQEDNSFQFLVNYLKGYCCLKSQHYSEAKLCLTYALADAGAVGYEGQYRLLLGRLLSAQGDHQAALTQCDAAKVASPRLASQAAYLATNTAHIMNLPTVELSYLSQLVQSLKSDSTMSEDGQMEGFEECCLSILTRQYAVSLPQALYSLSRQLYLDGYHVRAQGSYTELKELLRTCRGVSEVGLPRYAQILHETALAHFKVNCLKEGEQLCRQLIREHVPSSCEPRTSESPWETALYHLDDDVVSMLLLADIIAQSDNRKAVEELNRCYNALSESREQSGAEQNALMELCDWLLCRTLLRKARLTVTDDAVHYFRRALIHKPGDKEVLYHYKQWSLWHPDHQSFDPGNQVVVFPEAQLASLALRYLLGSCVSEEEWTALFDHESSQNVLESLFDDDD